jgi:predicted acylesterase/phospholipase RssA
MAGGVANNTPISRAIDLGANEIDLLPTSHAFARERPRGSALWRLQEPQPPHAPPADF